jgi:hypothetical protein
MKTFLTVLLALGLMSARPATAEIVTCTLDPTSARYYIAPSVTLDLSEFDDVIVQDAIIVSTGRQKVIGKISKDDSARLTVLWEVRDVEPNPAEYRAYGAHLVVRLTIQRPSGTARMTILDAQSRRYEYRTTGSCRFAK